MGVSEMGVQDIGCQGFSVIRRKKKHYRIYIYIYIVNVKWGFNKCFQLHFSGAIT